MVATVVFAACGLLCLAGFVALWPPGGLLVMAWVFLWVAATRADNKRRAVRR